MKKKDVFDIAQVEEALKECGIDIKNKDGNVKSFIDIFEELSKKWGDCQPFHDYIVLKSIDKFTENFCNCENFEEFIGIRR